MENLAKTYADSGVDTKKEDVAMSRIIPRFVETFENRKGLAGESLLKIIKHYAAIIKITGNQALAIKTDGVGTKTFIAQHMDKYDTVGIDCVAMNVNDIICTGAEPISFLDYLAIQKSDPDLIEEISKGLKTGADLAKVSIVGGETAIMPEMINGIQGKIGFDLAGSAIGIINDDHIINGIQIEEDDVLIGISSSGIHSNGLTLARDIFFKKNKFTVDKHFDELEGRSLGEELLIPTNIYVNEIMEMIRKGIRIKVLAHITSDGLRNLTRVGENCGYEINNLPKPQAIFDLIKNYGHIDDSEMYEVYNMGVGMCAVLPQQQLDSALQIAEKDGKKTIVMGRAIRDPEKKIKIRQLKIQSINEDKFVKY